MADAYLGRDLFLKIGPAANTLTQISGDGSGLSNFDIADAVGTRPIPGQGTSVQRQSLGVHDYTCTFEIDANATTWPLLHRKTGETIHVEAGRRGNGAGMPKEVLSGLATVTEAITYDDVIRFSVSIEVNGGIADSDYS